MLFKGNLNTPNHMDMIGFSYQFCGITISKCQLFKMDIFLFQLTGRERVNLRLVPPTFLQFHQHTEKLTIIF